MNYLILLPIIILWCAGGQGFLGARRFALPGVCYLYLAISHPDWQCLIMFGLIPILIMGYGENSWLRKYEIKNETFTRVFAAIFISSVFMLYNRFVGGDFSFNYILLIVNILAWQVRAGSLGKIFNKDILIEDICRSTALGVSLILVGGK